MAYQSLYRRFRPRRFGEVIGQDHVVRALQNAVREDRVGHAYLLSGPRGTGKTTAARLLAKALNCEQLGDDAEPCCECASCMAIETGTSFDLHELDAASNNKVDDIRDLIAKVALGTPGRTKVYLLDEVHMLTTGAYNALLKTLEEPPEHVVFVMATTDPGKVLDTIKSRAQHLRLNLVPADVMTAHIGHIVAEAELTTIHETEIDDVVRRGGGSVRDALSALDEVVAAGGVAPRDTSSVTLLTALADADPAVALAGISDAMHHGTEPRVIAETLVGQLRNVFLVAMGSPDAHMSETDAQQAAAYAERLRPAQLTRALEMLGAALIDMRQSTDPRIDLEVALVRLTNPTDDAPSDLLVRLERVEAQVKELGQRPTGSAPTAAPAPPSRRPRPRGPAADARASLDRAGRASTEAHPEPEAPLLPPETERDTATTPPETERDAATTPPETPPDEPAATAPRGTPPEEPAATAPRGTPPEEPAATAPRETPPEEPAATAPEPAPLAAPEITLETLVAAWETEVLDGLSQKAKARFRPGRFSALDETTVTFSLPTDMHRRRCEDVRGEVQSALVAKVGRKVDLRLEIDDVSGPGSGQTAAETRVQRASELPDEGDIDVGELVDADSMHGSIRQQLEDAFPGGEWVSE